MKPYTPTIESLKNKAPRELNAIFRKAASVSTARASSPVEKEAASQTMTTVLQCLHQAKD